MKRTPALACMLAFAAPTAWAQHAGHDMPQTQGMPGMSAEEHARMMQQARPPSPSPALPPPTAEERARAFPDPGGEYHFLNRAYGRGCAFLYGWARMTVIQTGSIATLLCDRGERYAQTLFDRGWLAAHDIDPQPARLAARLRLA